MTAYRKISADYIFPISSPPIKNGVVVVDERGYILEVDSQQSTVDNKNIEKFNGIICPGFVNTHCHLELSYMKNLIPEKLGMAGFIKNIVSKRAGFSREQILKAIEIAEQEMINNGIVAVGDISNDNSTFVQKAKCNLKYHTFFEVFDLNPNKAVEVFEKALQLEVSLKSFLHTPAAHGRSTPSRFHTSLHTEGSLSSIVPHASYSVSTELFKLISNHAYQNDSLISYHNQESLTESELFVSGSGAIADLFKNMGIKLSHISKTKLNSLQSTLKHFSRNNRTLLVHNTFTSKEDILWASNYFNENNYQEKLGKPLPTDNLFWCFCPNANLYIENALPDYQAFIDTKAICTIGTDSLASNHSLSVLDELKVISKHSSEISLETLLKWATLNGARFLNFDKELGSIEKGKNPGLNLITNVDLNKLNITDESKVEKLI